MVFDTCYSMYYLSMSYFFDSTACVFFFFKCRMQGSFWAWAEPMTDNATMLRRLSLAEPIFRIIPGISKISFVTRLLCYRLGYCIIWYILNIDTFQFPYYIDKYLIIWKMNDQLVKSLSRLATKKNIKTWNYWPSESTGDRCFLLEQWQ